MEGLYRERVRVFKWMVEPTEVLKAEDDGKLPDWLDVQEHLGTCYGEGRDPGIGLITALGVVKLNLGDYIIRRPSGELSVCKADDFDEGYEPALPNRTNYIPDPPSPGVVSDPDFQVPETLPIRTHRNPSGKSTHR